MYVEVDESMKICYVVGKVEIRYEGSYKEFVRVLTALVSVNVNQPEVRK